MYRRLPCTMDGKCLHIAAVQLISRTNTNKKYFLEYFWHSIIICKAKSNVAKRLIRRKWFDEDGNVAVTNYCDFPGWPTFCWWQRVEEPKTTYRRRAFKMISLCIILQSPRGTLSDAHLFVRIRITYVEYVYDVGEWKWWHQISNRLNKLSQAED